MNRETIRGNKALAQRLGVSEATICTWRKIGVLLPATLSEFRRVIIYDFDKVLECLNHRKENQGRRR